MPVWSLGTFVTRLVITYQTAITRSWLGVFVAFLLCHEASSFLRVICVTVGWLCLSDSFIEVYREQEAERRRTVEEMDALSQADPIDPEVQSRIAEMIR